MAQRLRAPLLFQKTLVQNSQHPKGISQVTVKSSSKGYDAPFWLQKALHACGAQTYVQEILIHKIKSQKKFKNQDS